MSTVRTAVVGGGLIGLAVARELLASIPGAQVSVFEKEPSVARHQSGHNSGVVHAGLYYEPGSLKARLCRRGVHLLREYASERNVAYQECGKIVVAHTERDVPRLTAILDRAVANGVPGVRLLEAAEIAEIEPHARGVKALHSPETAIIDYPGIAEALAADIVASGGRVLLNQSVDGIRPRGSEVVVSTPTITASFDMVVTCAGLQSDRVARLSGSAASPQIVPFFGDYFLLNDAKSHLVNGLIYPVPDPRYPFLGVHLTKRVDGRVILGPNAFLSFGREAYTRKGWSASDVAQAVTFPGFWRFGAQNATAAVRELRTVLSSAAFIREAQKYVPVVDRKDVQRASRGIRAQAMNADGSLVDDFVIAGTDRIVHIRNAPSPGATSSLAIAEHIVKNIVGERLRT